MLSKADRSAAHDNKTSHDNFRTIVRIIQSIPFKASVSTDHALLSRKIIHHAC